MPGLRLMLVVAIGLLILLSAPAGLPAQEWNDVPVRALLTRAAERRVAPRRDSQLVHYRSLARGTVLYLAQLGSEAGTAPRLLKTDQLEVEVYWRAPNRSKQVIRRWRERVQVPTGIRYHRDHLGIVVDEFGDRIRLGEGDEVRDLIHPVSQTGLDHYAFALTDSLELRIGSGLLRVYAVQVRPAEPGAAGVVGTLHLDAATADLVRLDAGFTTAAYRQTSLEDITLVLENALFEGRFWLPFRQEIEIRRRVSWLDFPFQTVIRAQWEIGDYDLETAVTTAVLAGGPWGGPRAAMPDTGWDTPIEAVSPGLASSTLDQLRRDVTTLVGSSALRVGPPARVAFGSVSDLVRVNRVQGLVTGLGASVRSGRVDLRPRLAYGWSDHRATGGLALGIDFGSLRLEAGAGRSIQDVGAWPVSSGALNSFLAQESGGDLGDYVMLDRAEVRGEWALASGASVGIEFGVERSTSVEALADPVSGALRPNPALGAGTAGVLRADLGGSGVRVTVEAGAGGGDRAWGRVQAEAGHTLVAGHGTLGGEVRAGVGTGDLPPYRAFAIGGRGTLVGEPYRGWGGRRAVLARIGWEVSVTLAGPEAGPVAAALGTVVIAPFVAAGWTGGSVTGEGWNPVRTDGVRPVVGLALDLLFGTLRLEAGWAPRARQLGLMLDASPPWWPVL